jgi:shikimate dehydrogenase|tara:strand:- start:374 stop:1219 length:846 start_codon:yes stop_codon:yes gene_type:complete
VIGLQINGSGRLILKSTPLYCVIGDPITHSRSPEIHRFFADQQADSIKYESKRVDEASFQNFVRNFFESGGAGLNITLPHKESAYLLCDELSERAALSRAVNTLFMDDLGLLHGENTDGLGLVRDIVNNHGVVIRNKRILIIGAGGAARGVIHDLASCNPASVSIINRTHHRAEALAKYFNVEALEVKVAFERNFDLIINATASSLVGELPPICSEMLAPNCCCYDMMYSKEDTSFVRWARENGVSRTMDGLGMLVEQAAEAFFLWRGSRPITAPLLKILR